MKIGLIYFLILAPIVAFIGYAITWIYKPNNPFWVYKQLKKLEIGSEWWAKGSADRFPKESPYYRPNHRTAKVTSVEVSFFKGEVHFQEYLDGKKIDGLTHLHARNFFDFYTPDE